MLCHAVEDFGKHHILINMSESFRLRVDDTGAGAGIFETGSMVLFGPDEYTGCMMSETAFQAIHISIDKEFADRILDTNQFSFRRLVNVPDPFIHNIAIKFRDLLINTHSEERIYGESLVVALIIHLSHEYPAANRGQFVPKGKLRAHQLKEVIDFTRSCMHYNVGLEELASLVNLSPYHFGRLFKQTVGFSPYQFVLLQKIEYAKRLMRQKSGPIGEIAYQLNFSDQAHFSNAFRKATGISPREFMRRAS